MTLHIAATETDQAIHDLVSLIEERFSIQINSDRLDAFHFAVKSSACGRFGSVESLVAAMRSGLVDAETWSQILHVATNHETRFFRHPPTIELIIEFCRSKAVPKILSVGCSTGEEPYSIAAALLRNGHPSFDILGIDISAPCIETARAGIYQSHPKLSNDVAVEVGEGRARFHSWIRHMVRFDVHNILSDVPIAMSAPDVVITQNMLIYYRAETRHHILNRLALELPKGGYLIAGPAEDAGWKCKGMTRTVHTHAAVFRKD